MRQRAGERGTETKTKTHTEKIMEGEQTHRQRESEKTWRVKDMRETVIQIPKERERWREVQTEGESPADPDTQRRQTETDREMDIER